MILKSIEEIAKTENVDTGLWPITGRTALGLALMNFSDGRVAPKLFGLL